MDLHCVLCVLAQASRSARSLSIGRQCRTKNCLRSGSASTSQTANGISASFHVALATQLRANLSVSKISVAIRTIGKNKQNSQLNLNGPGTLNRACQQGQQEVPLRSLCRLHAAQGGAPYVEQSQPLCQCQCELHMQMISMRQLLRMPY